MVACLPQSRHLRGNVSYLLLMTAGIPPYLPGFSDLWDLSFGDSRTWVRQRTSALGSARCSHLIVAELYIPMQSNEVD